MDKPIAAARGDSSARDRARRRSRDDALGSGAGENRISGMVADQARLGDAPPARLGRADRGLRQARATTKSSIDDARQRAHRRGLREGRRRRLVRGRRGRALPRARLRPGRLREDRRHPRRLVRFRLDPCLHARRPRPFSRPRRHQAQARRRRRRGDVSRRLRPASRLVPVVAARKLRHARPRALRRRADARLHARREGPQDVEVARQSDRSPQDVIKRIGRRHPAPVGRRASTIPTISASARKSSRPSATTTASCATRSAGCSARSPITTRGDAVGFADDGPNSSG